MHRSVPLCVVDMGFIECSMYVSFIEAHVNVCLDFTALMGVFKK